MSINDASVIPGSVSVSPSYTLLGTKVFSTGR